MYGASVPKKTRKLKGSKVNYLCSADRAGITAALHIATTHANYTIRRTHFDVSRRDGDQGDYYTIRFAITSRAPDDDDTEAWGRLVISATYDSGWWRVEAHAASSYEAIREDAVIARYKEWPGTQDDLNKAVARWLRDAVRRLERRYLIEQTIRPALRRTAQTARAARPDRAYDNIMRYRAVRIIRRVHRTWPYSTQIMARNRPDRVGCGLALRPQSVGRRAVLLAYVDNHGSIRVSYRGPSSPAGSGDQTIVIPSWRARRDFPAMVHDIVNWDYSLIDR